MRKAWRSQRETRDKVLARLLKSNFSKLSSALQDPGSLLLLLLHFSAGNPDFLRGFSRESCHTPIWITWLLSLAAFLAISMSGRPSMLNPWLPSLRCLALYSTWIKENRDGQYILRGGCLVILRGRDLWGAGAFSPHTYLTGLFGCLRGLLDVWPISHCGVMQVFLGIFFVCNLYLERKECLLMWKICYLWKSPHQAQTTVLLKPNQFFKLPYFLNYQRGKLGIPLDGTSPLGTKLGSTDSAGLWRAWTGELTLLCFLATSIACFTSGGSSMME